VQIYLVLQILLLALCSLGVLYLLPFALAGLFYKRHRQGAPAQMARMAVLIPGYKEDEVIVDTAVSALQQDYPQDRFDVVIIADSFQPATLMALRTLKVKVIEVAFDKSTKAKALNKAMAQLEEVYDVAVVLDADNLMAPDFLKKVNAAFTGNTMAVQGHRVAKNQNNAMAVLDAVSEEINNHIFRKGHRVLGYSSAIIGSGMAFPYDYFKSLMAGVGAVGGFDKEIELKMLKAGYKIEYLDDALVYDEKIQDRKGFQNQRRRWLSAQFLYFRQGIFGALKDLVVKGNLDYFDKTMQFIQPPRVLLMAAILFFGTLFSLSNSWLNAPLGLSVAWLVLATGCAATLAMSIPRSLYTKRTFRALGTLPGATMLMFWSLLRVRGANKTFLHTKHFSKTGNAA
jgi:cellulose synthase/poly-beta-1,6-N-acetylglucosamine synthase-like glycosyltransferase